MTLILTRISTTTKKKLRNHQTLSAPLASRMDCRFSAEDQQSIPSRAREAVQEKPHDESRSASPATTTMIHLLVYYLHMNSTAVQHHNSRGCVISYCAAAIPCSGPWQNTTWWLFQSQAKTAEAEGSATKPGYLLFIMQFPDWWVHKPAAKCCVLYCQQTNGLDGRQGE